jgi:membrane-associated protease RseP (regulator of RpoE activity)
MSTQTPILPPAAPPPPPPAAPPETPGGSPAPGPTGTPTRPAWALLRLAAVLALIVGVFLLLGLGDLLLVIAVIIVMVMVHELGHFATAKWAGMKVTQYFVGFGPPLWSVRRGETEYGVKPILAGGYVKIVGMTNLEEVDPDDEPRSYRRQPFHKRIIVASAGSFMHFVMAFVLAWVAVVAFGTVSSNVAISGFTSWQGYAHNAAQAAGLRAGDVIDQVNGHRLTGPDQLESTISHSIGRPVTLGVLRGGHQLEIPVTPRDGRSLRSGGQTMSPINGPAHGFIGVELSPTTSGEGPVRALGTAAMQVGSVTAATVTGLGHFFSPHGLSSFFDQVTNSQAANRAASNPATATRPESIIGAARAATQAEQAGILYLLDVLIVLNIAIGLLNMLPMLPLDGGHVAIAVYERIRTRRGRPYYQADAAKLLPVVYAFVAVLLVVVTSAVFLDIAHPVSNPFH